MQTHPELSFDHVSQGWRVEFGARPRLLTIALTVLWCAGWLYLLTLLVLDSVRFGSWNVFSIALLVVAGLPVAAPLMWAALGKRESLIVTPSELRIDRWVGPFPISRTISIPTIVELRPHTVPSGPHADFLAVREFYGVGCGALAIATSRRTVSVGHTIGAHAAIQLIEQIRHFTPHIATAAEEPVRGRRAPDYIKALITASLVGFAFTMPARVFVIDGPICFYDESIVPERPIDVSRLAPARRVVLVPIDDFPFERATAIAEHFRTQFGVAITVTPTLRWPDTAYDERRGQMNSAVMLTRLESMYATRGTPVVAIGLTTRDMFNSEVNWAYVFSYRRNNKAAVVSPARMDRGCMGLLPADDDRIAARLRKMVGKNIGIMYFGLDMSADPASMLYARIGGPQELDAMSELF